MTRRKRISLPKNDEPGLNISSLIDVCFLLLIYFIVTTQIVRKEQEITSSIPTMCPQRDISKIEPLRILIEANGRIAIKNETGLLEMVETNPDSRELPALSARLKLLKDISLMSGQQALVQVTAHDNTSHQRVIDVLNTIAGANITDITFTDNFEW